MAFSFDITSALIVTVAALITGFVYFVLQYRYQRKTDIRAEEKSDMQTAKLDKNQVDLLADAVKKNQAETARVLKRETEEIATRTRMDMEDYVDKQTIDIKTDYAHKFEVVELKLHAINESIANVIERNAETALINAKTAERLEKQMDRIQQFEWGRDAKSEPAFMRGEEETEAHKEKPEEGLFKDDE